MWIHWLKLMELSSQADLYFRCKSWLPKRTFILAARVDFPSVPSFSLQELTSQAYFHFHCKSWIPQRTFIFAARAEIPSVPSFSLQPSCLPLIIPLRTWWRIFVAHKWPFSRLSWGVGFTACELLFRHLIQGSKRNEQDNCSATASLTCTLKHHSLEGCRHHQMQVVLNLFKTRPTALISKPASRHWQLGG